MKPNCGDDASRGSFSLPRCENSVRQKQLEEQKTAHIEALNRRKEQDTNQMARLTGQWIERGAEMGAQGLARQIAYMDQSFGEFAKSFLRAVAEMIMQSLILLAIKQALGFFGLGTAAKGTVTMAGEGGSNLMLAAAGGMFPGLIRAAGGVEGVSEVSSPTIFPRFNVMAGEAGREMLTVLARPQSVDLGGVSAVVGYAGMRQLAIIDAAAVSRPRMMAGGGSIPSLPVGSGRVGGDLSIEVHLGPGLEAGIVKDSIDGAVVRVTQEMQRPSQLSAATKRLVR